MEVYFTGASDDGIHNVAGGITTDYWRPGAEELSGISFAQANWNAIAPLYFAANPTSGLVETIVAQTANLSMFAYAFEFIGPIVLDLNGDGVKLTSFEEGRVLFDVDADGAREQTGWVSAADGLLVRDLFSERGD